jgi:hypothetical protein
MNLFGKNGNRKSAVTGDSRFKYILTPQESAINRTCASCGSEMHGRMYHCPECHSFFCPECAVQSLGGATCPICSQVQYLQVVI